MTNRDAEIQSIVQRPPLCSLCNKPADLVPKATRFRRGDRVLPFDGWIWACSFGCADPEEGQGPYRFSTFELMVWEEREARTLWKERFGEAMPPSMRARGPEERRTVRVPVLLTPSEAVRLDPRPVQ